MKTLISPLLLVISMQVSAQEVIKFRATHYCTMIYEPEEWSEWEESDVLITFIGEDKVKVSNKNKDVFDVTSSEEITESKNGVRYKMLELWAEDQKGQTVKIHFGNAPNGLQFMVYYEEYLICWLVKPN